MDKILGFFEGFIVFFLIKKSVGHIFIKAKFAAMSGFFHGIAEVDGLAVGNGCVGGAM